MTWIESHQSLERHRKTLRLSEALGVGRYTAIGHLHVLWWWGLDNADINGHLDGIGAKGIAEAAGWTKNPTESFTAALVTAGFLEESEAGYTLHDWFEYAGKLNVRRESDRRRKAVQRTSAGHRPELPSPSVRTVPNRTVPNPDPSDQSSGASRAAAPKKVSPHVTDEEREWLRCKWTAHYAAELDEQIELSLQHEQAKKYSPGPWKLYVNNWLRRGAAPGGSHANPTRTTDGAGGYSPARGGHSGYPARTSGPGRVDAYSNEAIIGSSPPLGL